MNTARILLTLSLLFPVASFAANTTAKKISPKPRVESEAFASPTRMVRTSGSMGGVEVKNFPELIDLIETGYYSKVDYEDIQNVIKQLLNEGADISETDVDSQDILEVVIKKGFTELIPYLAQKAPNLVDQTKKDLYTDCCRLNNVHGNLNILKALTPKKRTQKIVVPSPRPATFADSPVVHMGTSNGNRQLPEAETSVPVPAPITKPVTPPSTIETQPAQSPSPSPVPAPMEISVSSSNSWLGDQQLIEVLDHGYEAYAKLRGMLMEEVLPFNPDVTQQSNQTGCTLAHMAACSADVSLANELQKRLNGHAKLKLLFETVRDKQNKTACEIAATSQHLNAAQFTYWLLSYNLSTQKLDPQTTMAMKKATGSSTQQMADLIAKSIAGKYAKK